MRRITWLSLIVGSAVLGAAPITEARLSPVEVCPSADPGAWFASNVDPGTLTWDSFVSYSPAERAIIERRVSRDLRVTLRRQHLARIGELPSFNSEQKAIIHRVRAWYDQSVAARDPRDIQDLKTAVARSFTRDEAWLAFRLLGSTEPVPAAPMGDTESDKCGCLVASECPPGDVGIPACLGTYCEITWGCGKDGRLPCLGNCL